MVGVLNRKAMGNTSIALKRVCVQVYSGIQHDEICGNWILEDDNTIILPYSLLFDSFSNQEEDIERKYSYEKDLR